MTNTKLHILLVFFILALCAGCGSNDRAESFTDSSDKTYTLGENGYYRDEAGKEYDISDPSHIIRRYTEDEMKRLVRISIEAIDGSTAQVKVIERYDYDEENGEYITVRLSESDSTYTLSFGSLEVDSGVDEVILTEPFVESTTSYTVEEICSDAVN